MLANATANSSLNMFFSGHRTPSLPSDGGSAHENTAGAGVGGGDRGRGGDGGGGDDGGGEDNSEAAGPAEYAVAEKKKAEETTRQRSAQGTRRTLLSAHAPILVIVHHGSGKI